MLIDSIPEAFESRVRLAIQTALLSGPKTFNEIKGIIGATDGNLSSHLTKLESLRYISFRKEFIGKKPRTTYTLTDEGRQHFHEYVALLESIINGIDLPKQDTIPENLTGNFDC